MRNRIRAADWLAALSLANLIFLRCWTELLSPDGNRVYWLMSMPAPMHYLALMLDVLLLGAFFYVLMGGIRKKSRTAGRIMVVCGLLILLSLVNSLRTMITNSGGSLFLRFVEQRAPIIGVAIAILLVAALVFGGIRALRPVYKLLFLVSPFLFFTFGQTLYRNASFDDRPTRSGPMAPRLAAQPAGAPRVIWVIFDEWDEELTFAERPSRIQLPEIDLLRASDFSASDAIPPNLATDWSMPALTTGIALDDIYPRGAAELMIRPRDSATYVRLERAGHGLPRGPEDGLQHRRSGLGDPLLPGAEERPLGLLVVERQQPIQQCGKHAAGDARPTWRAASTKTSTVRRSDNPFPPRGTVG